MTRKRELLIVAATLGLTAGLPGPVAAQSSGNAVSSEAPSADTGFQEVSGSLIMFAQIFTLMIDNVS